MPPPYNLLEKIYPVVFSYNHNIKEERMHAPL